MEKKSTKSGFGIGVIIMAVAAVIALPLRTVQFFTVLEGSSGFYAGYDWSVYLLYGLLILAFAAVMICAFVKRKKLDYSPVRRKSAFYLLYLYIITIARANSLFCKKIKYF